LEAFLLLGVTNAIILDDEEEEYVLLLKYKQQEQEYQLASELFHPLCNLLQCS
jgi:hypothetical protein